MQSFSAGQSSIVVSDKKLNIKWLFEIDTDLDGIPDYFYSTQSTTFCNQAYTAKILDFKKISFNRNVSEYGLSVPSKLNFSISNAGNVLNGSDFEGASCLVRLIVEDENGYALGTNLISNEGFENFTGTEDDGSTDIFDDWTNVGDATGNLILSVTDSHSGYYALKFVRSSTNLYVYQDIDISSLPVRTGLRLSFWTKANGKAGYYRVYDATNSADIIAKITTGVSGTTYTKVTYDFIRPVGCNTVRIYFFATDDGAGVEYFDDVSLQEIESELMRWNFKIQHAPSVAQKLKIIAKDWLQDYLQGDYPPTSLIQDLFPSSDPHNDNVCVPRVWGTAYIPVRSAYITSSRFYVLGAYSDSNFGAEKLANVGFETAGGGGDDVFGSWTESKGSGTIANETSIVNGGSHACKIIAGASDDCRLYQDFAVTAGKLHKLVFYTRGDGTHAGQYRVYDATNSADIIAKTETGVSGTTYTKVEIWFTAPYGCSSIRFFLWGPSTNTAYCYFDDISIKEVTDYTITKVRSPIEFGISTWTSFFKYYRKVGSDGNAYICAEFIICDSNLDGTNDANGLFLNGQEFVDVPCKYSYTTTSGYTNPADIIEYILLDMGVPSTKIDSVSLAAIKSTFTSWGLSFNGGIWYKTDKRKYLAKLLSMCHLELIVRDKIYFKIHSKTSQDTIDSSLVIKGTFDVSPIDQNNSKDSGYGIFQEADVPIDSMIKILVPAKSSTNDISNITIECDYIQDDQDAQAITQLGLQRRLLREKEITFEGSTTLIGLEVDDVITIDGSNYDSEGSTYDVLIDQLDLNYDLSVGIKAVRYSEVLDDFGDLSPSAISVASDDTTIAYRTVISGPDSVGPTGDEVPNALLGRLVVGDDSTNIVIDSDKSGDRVIYSGKTDFTNTDAGFILGIDHSDSDKVKLYLGNSTDYLNWTGNGLVINVGSADAITITAGGDISLKGHDSNAGKIYWDGTNYTVEMFCNTSGSLFYFRPVTTEVTNLYMGSASNYFKTWYGYIKEQIDFKVMYDGANSSMRMRMVSNDDNSCYWDLEIDDSVGNYRELIAEYTGSIYAFRPNENQIWDLGLDNYEWDDLWYKTAHDEADYFLMDNFDDLQLISQIKGSGKIDERTGLEIIDDNSLPKILLSKVKKDHGIYEDIIINGIKQKKFIAYRKKGDIAYNKQGKPYINNTVLKSLFIGSIKQLNNIVIGQRLKINALLEEFNLLKEELNLLKGRNYNDRS